MTAHDLAAPARTAADSTGSVWRLVAAREIRVKLRDRNFLVSTALMLVLVMAVLGIQFAFSGHTSTKKIAVQGPAATAVVTSASSMAQAADAKLKLVPVPANSPANVEAEVISGKADAGLLRAGDGWRLVSKSDRDAQLATYLGQAVQEDAVRRNAAAAGTSLPALQRGAHLPYGLLQPNGHDVKAARIGGVVFGMLFYLAALLFGMAIANSVVEEKQNRIVEIIAAAIPLRQLLIGKIVGNTVLAMAQVVLLALVGVGGLLVTGNSSLLGQLAGGIGWFVPFFLVGFLALAALWAVVGALATRSEDVQSTSAPMTALVAIVFFGGIFVTGTAQAVLSFVPVFSTIAMPARVLTGHATWWEPLVSLVIALAGAHAILRVAERMYRRALLQTSRKLSLREAFTGRDAEQPSRG
ncbi:ABC transporter permease [Flexivirga caeni]|uniref:ABC transporter permease n=1 Tax=Flexivirga caeni TaxID=2294115 RepID=A0A3M9MIP6_9MICO|nr:ABC transporter permease [Flexivirga caeni]RNI25450.1 ABC transporter permease [Flexivirga caeni]